MSKFQHFKIKEQVSEDAAGTIFRAVQQSSGKRVALRKYKTLPSGKECLEPVEEVAFHVAIERLSSIRHTSLRRVLSGGTDPQDSVPYVATHWQDAEPLPVLLKQTYLSVEVATMMLSQLLELCELLSHVLAEEGVWVETEVASIAVTGDAQETHFVFWAAPLKCLSGGKPRDFDCLVTLTEAVLGWAGREIDEREGSHLVAWLQWLKEDAKRNKTTIREIREMLAAAAGVEPPPPIASLLAEATRRRSWLEKIPIPKLRFHTPKMPLFVMLSVLLVVQSIAGWLWIRKINADIERELGNIDLSVPDVSYAIEGGEDEEGVVPVLNTPPGEE